MIVNGTFLKYLTVGGLSAGIKFSIYSLLLLIGISYHVAATIGYALSAIVHFLGNRVYTFDSQENIYFQIFKYLFFTSLNYIVTIKVIQYSIELLQINPYFSMILALTANVMSNFLLAKLFVYKTRVIETDLNYKNT